MKFQDYKYDRPVFEDIKAQLEALFAQIEGADSAEAQLEAVEAVNKIRSHVQTMGTLASIRHSIDTTDEFYDGENQYWDQQGPLYDELTSNFYQLLVASKFRPELEAKLSKQFFKLAEYSLKAFSPEIIEDLQEENRLSSEYSKLMATAKLNFRGEELTLPGIGKYLVDSDRSVREEASQVKYAWYTENESTIESIYDQQVKLRAKIAKKLGFNNFVELGYVRMNRTDYNPEMVANFRQQVLDYIVPVASELYEKQRQRLGLDKLEYFDLNFEFLSGNATPKGSPEWIVENGVKMYSELSAETKEFFDLMVEKDLLDLVNKLGKQGGGYCTYISDYKVPFIFSNFNGTKGDIDVLTHEAGHAFQVYSSRHIEVPELSFPTYESCEIHSMSMEFFAWPWMDLFFKEETAKYKYSHLGDAIKFIPYGVTVDAYQHWVYENPEATPAERKEAWRNIEKQFLPHKDYSKCDFLEQGGWWMQQAHIFGMPFYYIDYTLAQICALQFWKRDQENHAEAWHDYLELCKVGGTMSFVELC
ncbi:MAG: M3 family oligoendopeptidase, partial [Turicibacter sp.]|nr:M3 family oligoendopeptidase [Turicibacter sp.]